jgi:hypothetical protein
MNKFFLPLVSLVMVAAPMAAQAAPCRDAHGRFTACTSAAAKPAMKPKMVAAKPATPAVAHAMVAKAPAKRCKINGRFASCSAPGAKPV